jgi:predicted transcriptional regulator
MTLRSPAGRDSRADEARQKIRKVGELIRLRQKIKTNVSQEAARLASLDKAAAELDAGKGVPIEHVRENVREWATSPKNPKK